MTRKTAAILIIASGVVLFVASIFLFARSKNQAEIEKTLNPETPLYDLSGKEEDGPMPPVQEDVITGENRPAYEEMEALRAETVIINTDILPDKAFLGHLRAVAGNSSGEVKILPVRAKYGDIELFYFVQEIDPDGMYEMGRLKDGSFVTSYMMESLPSRFSGVRMEDVYLGEPKPVYPEEEGIEQDDQNLDIPMSEKAGEEE